MDLIDKPGVYPDIPMEVYHDQLTVTPSVSSSGLRAIENESPAHYFARSYLNPKRTPMSSPSLNFGKAAHALIFGDEEFDKQFALSPFDSYRTKDAKEWRDQIEKQGKTPVTSEQIEQIKDMAMVLKRDPAVQAGILAGEQEQSLVWKDEETGIWLKARPDVMPHDDWISDYKTTSSMLPMIRVENSIVDYGYHMQLGLVAEGMVALGMSTPTKFVLVFQEVKPPYSVMPISLGWELVRHGVMQNRRAIRKFAECLERNEWPGPDPYLGDYYGPQWFTARMDRDEEGGLLPHSPAWVDDMKTEESA